MHDQTNVYEIDVTKKYIMVFESRLSLAGHESITRSIKEWLASDNPFLLLDGRVKLVRVEDAEAKP